MLKTRRANSQKAPFHSAAMSLVSSRICDKHFYFDSREMFVEAKALTHFTNVRLSSAPSRATWKSCLLEIKAFPSSLWKRIVNRHTIPQDEHKLIIFVDLCLTQQTWKFLNPTVLAQESFYYIFDLIRWNVSGKLDFR